MLRKRATRSEVWTSEPETSIVLLVRRLNCWRRKKWDLIPIRCWTGEVQRVGLRVHNTFRFLMRWRADNGTPADDHDFIGFALDPLIKKCSTLYFLRRFLWSTWDAFEFSTERRRLRFTDAATTDATLIYWRLSMASLCEDTGGREKGKSISEWFRARSVLF